MINYKCANTAFMGTLTNQLFSDFFLRHAIRQLAEVAPGYLQGRSATTPRGARRATAGYPLLSLAGNTSAKMPIRF
jgi:hypothetical protein